MCWTLCGLVCLKRMRGGICVHFQCFVWGLSAQAILPICVCVRVCESETESESERYPRECSTHSLCMK